MASRLTTTAAPAAPTGTRPGWLKPRAPQPVIEIVPPVALDQRQQNWWSRLVLAITLFWQGMYLGWGMLASLALHTVVVLGLAITYFSTSDDIGLSMMGGFNPAKELDELDIPVDSRLDDPTGESVAQLQFTAVSALENQGSLMNSTETVLGDLEADGKDPGEGDQVGELGSNIKVPESAVTRGSFTVWTEPKDPKPRSKYEIIIQVKLPANVKQYRLRDLTGMVVGTDGYRKQIKFKSTERKGVKDGVVQIAISIPGAAQLVKDTIQIRSQVLDEEQTIEIVF